MKLKHLEMALQEAARLGLQLLEQAAVERGDLDGGDDVVVHGLHRGEGWTGRGPSSPVAGAYATGRPSRSRVRAGVQPLRVTAAGSAREP